MRKSKKYLRNSVFYLYFIYLILTLKCSKKERQSSFDNALSGKQTRIS